MIQTILHHEAVLGSLCPSCDPFHSTGLLLLRSFLCYFGAGTGGDDDGIEYSATATASAAVLLQV